MIKNTLTIHFWYFDVCVKPSNHDIDYNHKTIMPHDNTMSFTTTQSLTWTCSYNYSKKR
jgi:hypothetical protein